MQQKKQRMVADMLFYRMLQDMCIVLFYMTDNLPNFKFSETVMQIIWTYVVIRDVVEGVSIISEVPDWWLRPGNR